MSTSPKGDDKPTPPSRSTVVLMLATAADTTWRMFVPTIGLMLAGLMIDRQLGTKPWLMIVGLVLGVVLAWALVKRQMDKVKK